MDLPKHHLFSLRTFFEHITLKSPAYNRSFQGTFSANKPSTLSSFNKMTFPTRLMSFSLQNFAISRCSRVRRLFHSGCMLPFVCERHSDPSPPLSLRSSVRKWTLSQSILNIPHTAVEDFPWVWHTHFFYHFINNCLLPVRIPFWR
jgi:hypothetical protein